MLSRAKNHRKLTTTNSWLNCHTHSSVYDLPSVSCVWLRTVWRIG